MKKSFLALLVSTLLLAGCAGRDGQQGTPGGFADAQTGQGEISGGAVDAQTVQQEASGAQEVSPPASVSSNLMIDRNQIFEIYPEDSAEESERKGAYVGMQFYQGEPVLLWIKPYETYISRRTEDGEYRTEAEYQNPDCGLYVCRMDGSRELLVPGLSLMESLGIERGSGELFTYYKYSWYVDGEGSCYCIPYGRNGGEGRGCFLKLDSSGELLYRAVLEEGFGVEDFCCLNGEMYAVISQREDGASVETKKLAAFDSATGVFSGEEPVLLELDRTECHFGEGAGGLYLFTGQGIKKADLGDGSVTDILPFGGSTYSKPDFKWQFQDLRVLEDGSVETLYFRGDQENLLPDRYVGGMLERLSMVEGERTLVTLRAARASGWMKNQAAEFNKSNGEYWVVLEELSDSTAADLEDYTRQASVEIAAGKGPDLICGDMISSDVRGLIEKGVFLELGDRMEASGIREEDYLTSAFGSWRKEENGDSGIYGITPCLYPVGYQMRRDVLGGGAGTDIYSLMDALSVWKEEANYYAYWGAEDVLRAFLEGSADLWGMVDWEQGSCDFGGELFGQILENAKRYGYDETHRNESLVRRLNLSSIYQYDSLAEREAQGTAMCGVLFDDGCHGVSDGSGTLAVNAASPRKDGAWEFICFLLGAEAQVQLEGAVPVNRGVLEAWLQAQLEETGNGGEKSIGGSYLDGGEIVKFSKTYTAADMTKERVEEYLGVLEEVRCLPFRTGPILDIIYEEAEAYFGGGRSAEDVGRIVQNRVQLYLDENRQSGR